MSGNRLLNDVGQKSASGTSPLTSAKPVS